MRMLIFALFAFACGNSGPTMIKMAATGTVGAGCAADPDCTQTNATCVLPNTGINWPGGYCTVKGCDTAACPDGATCQIGHMGLGAACMYKCTADIDCRTGYKCCNVTAPAGTGLKVCAPDPCFS
jgi:hypothetical protein